MLAYARDADPARTGRELVDLDRDLNMHMRRQCRGTGVLLQLAGRQPTSSYNASRSTCKMVCIRMDMPLVRQNRCDNDIPVVSAFDPVLVHGTHRTHMLARRPSTYTKVFASVLVLHVVISAIRRDQCQKVGS